MQTFLKTLLVLALSTQAIRAMNKRVEDADEIIGEGHLGYQIIKSKLERLNPIICHSSIGAVPGKVTEIGDTFFSFNKKEYVCRNSDPVIGNRIPNEGEIPVDCEGKAFVTKGGVSVYSVVTSSRHGEIPGKAYDATEAFYGFEKEQYRSEDFDWIC